MTIGLFHSPAATWNTKTLEHRGACGVQWMILTLRWRHNGRDSVSNHQPHDCLFNRLFRRRSKKTSKLRVTGLYAGNSPGTGEFPAQMASNAENVSSWWHHHEQNDGHKLSIKRDILWATAVTKVACSENGIPILCHFFRGGLYGNNNPTMK